MIIERPLYGKLVVQSFDLIASPFMLGFSKLGFSKLGETNDPAQWRDWSADVMNVTVHRGARREGANLTNEIGLMTVVLKDPGNALDDQGIHPNQPARLLLRLPSRTSDPNPEEWPLFTGKIHDVQREMMQLDGSNRRTPVLTLIVADAVRTFNNTTRYGAAGPDTFRERLARLAGSTNEPIELPSAGTVTTRQARTVYESSLSNHFTMACNTAGAMWWVGADGVTRFALRDWREVQRVNSFGYPGTGLSPIRMNVTQGLDGFVNRLYTQDHVAIPDPENPGNWIAGDRLEEVLWVDSSIARWGDRAAVFDTCREYAPPNATDWYDVMYRLMGPYLPAPLPKQITWNAQEDLYAAGDLEIGRSIDVYDDELSVSRTVIIIGIHHTITATRWLIDLDLIETRY